MWVLSYGTQGPIAFCHMCVMRLRALTAGLGLSPNGVLAGEVWDPQNRESPSKTTLLDRIFCWLIVTPSMGRRANQRTKYMHLPYTHTHIYIKVVPLTIDVGISQDVRKSSLDHDKKNRGCQLPF